MHLIEDDIVHVKNVIYIRMHSSFIFQAVQTQTTDSRTPGRQQPEEDGEVEAGEDVALEEADFLASGASRGKELYLLNV